MSSSGKCAPMACKRARKDDDDQAGGSRAKTTIEALPEFVLERIFGFFDVPTLSTIRHVSTQFHEICDQQFKLRRVFRLPELSSNHVFYVHENLIYVANKQTSRIAGFDLSRGGELTRHSVDLRNKVGVINSLAVFDYGVIWRCRNDVYFVKNPWTTDIEEVEVLNIYSSDWLTSVTSQDNRFVVYDFNGLGGTCRIYKCDDDTNIQLVHGRCLPTTAYHDHISASSSWVVLTSRCLYHSPLQVYDNTLRLQKTMYHYMGWAGERLFSRLMQDHLVVYEADHFLVFEIKAFVSTKVRRIKCAFGRIIYMGFSDSLNAIVTVNTLALVAVLPARIFLPIAH